MTSPFDYILNTKITEGSSTRLPFGELCAFYAALVDGVPPRIVSVATGLAITSVGSLKAAGTFHAGQIRYPKIAAEFRRLGREPFIHRYVTAEIHDRIRVAGDQVKRARLEPKPFAGVNPRASKFAGVHTLKDPRGADVKIEIAFARSPDSPGWKWRRLGPFSQYDDIRDAWRGDPRHQERAFAKSKDAYDFCRLRFLPTEAQILDNSAFQAMDDAAFYAPKP